MEFIHPFRLTICAVVALMSLAAPAGAASARHHGTAPSPSAGASRVSTSLMPSTPDSPIKGSSGDRVFGGAKGETITGLWTRADRRQLRGFMIYLPVVQCTGGFTSVDLRRVLDVVPLNTHGSTAGRLFGNSVNHGKFGAASVQTVSYGGAAEVSGTIEESIDGTIRGDHVSGHYSATISLVDGSGASFATCTVSRVAWSATSGAGRHFVGGTWANPLYLERSADGKRVAKFRIGAGLTCNDGRWDTYIHFSGVPVKHGKFSLDTDTTDPWGDENLHDITQGRGTFQGGKARGTFSEDATFSDLAGNVTDHCVQESVEWTAFSSTR